MELSTLFLAASAAARATLAPVEAAGLVPGDRPQPSAAPARAVEAGPLRLPPKAPRAEPVPLPEAARDGSAAPRNVRPIPACRSVADGEAA